MTRLLIIQNTADHFETTLSLYELARLAGYDPYIYRCPSRRKFAYNTQHRLYPDGRFFNIVTDKAEQQPIPLNNLSPEETVSFERLTRALKRFEEQGWPINAAEADPYKQADFLRQHKLQVADQDVLDNADAGIVVTAYPTETAIYEELPSKANPVIQRLLSRLLFISHRFKNRDDYRSPWQFLTQQNTFCLSPLASRVGLDHITLTSLPIEVPDVKFSSVLQLTIQAYFAKQQRELSWFLNQTTIWPLIEQRKIAVHMLGAAADVVMPNIKNVQRCANFEESRFYAHLLRNTHVLLPLITPSTDYDTYSTERYSSSFNLAWGCEKPLFCHEWFENVYNVPGIYYNESNFTDMFSRLIQLTESEYRDMVQELRRRKQSYAAESASKLRAKLERLLAQ